MAKSEVGPWAKDKLERLGKYLRAYTTIMNKQDWCEGYYYFDAFAGPGEHEFRSGTQARRQTLDWLLPDVASVAQSDDEQREYLSGSPRVALDVEPPFTQYVFIERSPSRVRELEQLRTEYGSRRSIAIRQEDCNEYLRRVIPTIDWRARRALAFLDPFGMQVPWDTLIALAHTKGIEVFLNFPDGMAIQRLLPRDTTKITQQRRAMLDKYFGSPEWYDVVYRKEKTLFGEEQDTKIKKSGQRLVKWYRNRLKNEFGYASKAALITNTRGNDLYYLLLASPNKTGVKIADYILSAGTWV